MKKQSDERDERIREIFSAAREADRASAPGFREIVDRERVDGSSDAPRRGLRLVPAFALATSLAVAALAVVWMSGPAPQRAPVQVAENRSPAPAVSPPPAPVPTPAEPEVDRGEVEAPPEIVTRKFYVPPKLQDSEEAPKKPPPPPPPAPKPSPTRKPPVLHPRRLAELEEFVRIGFRDAAKDAAVLETVRRREEAKSSALSRDGDPNVHGSRTRDFKAVVGGASNTNSIEEMESVMSSFALERHRTDFNTEDYDRIVENEFLAVGDHPLSTFSIDVDSASYANVRRFLTSGQRPPRDAVRIEELINYFDYDYPEPTGGEPFAVHTEVAGCPWNEEHTLLRIGLKGREITRDETAGSNLVFLIDVSGSMAPENKLPLLKKSLRMLVRQLDGRDQVAIVVYAGAAWVVLDSTPGDRKDEVLGALQRLESDGGTNGGAGLRRAYRIARRNFIPGGVNRVILATDGDFNIGVTTRTELLSLIEKKARSGIYLTVLGFGMGNYQDGMLEMLTGRGNGNYAYIDSRDEARKVLVEQMSGTLIAIAKDVKIQVEFNPAEVDAYRLIGYENRVMAKEDFNDDRKDAGEIGAGHTVTALYEIVPAGRSTAGPAVDPLKYQTPAEPSRAATAGELLTIKLRYKEPDEEVSRLLAVPIPAGHGSFEGASSDFKFAAAVAEFGMLLRDSEHLADGGFEQVSRLALQGIGADEAGYRAEFLKLIGRAERVVSETP